MTDERWGELFSLTSALLEGELSEKDAERLVVWLSIDDEAQSHYARALQLHAALTLEFMDGAGVNPANSLASLSQATSCSDALPQGKNDAPMAAAATVAPREQKRMVASASCGAVTTVCKRLTVLSGRVIVACLAVMLAVVAVFGSERLISEVLSARRASQADQAGGMIVSRGDGNESVLMRKANEESGTRRIGSSGHSSVALASVFLFPLPPIHALEQIESAQLEWTYKRKDGDPQFSVDLYGLGFVEPGSAKQFGFWEGPNDKTLRAAYGMAGSAERRVALVKRSVMTPHTSRGRISIESRELVRFLQSLYEDGAQEGDFAVFRLNADSPTSRIKRETGYAVVHPPSLSELTSPEELPVLTITARSQLNGQAKRRAEAVMATHSVSEHWSGGLVRSFNNLVQPGSNSDGTRRVGSSLTDRVGLVNVFVFPLPPIERIDGVVSARLQWTLASKDNAPGFSVDLYGLGYVRGDSYHGPCFWEGNRDDALAADYGLLGGTERRVALVAKRAMSPATPCGQVVVENLALVDFLRSLYDDGAEEGDLVVFRLNSDIPTLDIARGSGYSVVHAPEVAGRTTEADLPVLLMTLN